MDKGELEPRFRALRDVSIALEQTWRMANAARGEATEAARTVKVVTQADCERAVANAKARIAEARICI
jgi:hypothetical protein